MLQCPLLAARCSGDLAVTRTRDVDEDEMQESSVTAVSTRPYWAARSRAVSDLLLVMWMSAWCYKHITAVGKAFTDIRLRPGIAPLLLPYDPLRPNMTSSTKLEYITYRNAARGGSSHGHKICKLTLIKIGPARFQRYARGQTDRQTDAQRDGLITILHTLNGAE